MTSLTQIDLTNNDDPAHGQTSTCPICDISLPIDDIAAHCEDHFASDATPEAGQPSVEFAVCGNTLPLEDLTSHELAHQLHEHAGKGGTAGPGALAEDVRLREVQGLRGILPRTRLGKCFRCGASGHWAKDCQSNPANIAAKERILLYPTHAAVAAAQQPDPQWAAVASGDPNFLINLLASQLLEQRLPQGGCRQTTMLSGAVAHFGGQPYDSEFGCGYRNLQAQAYHALKTCDAARHALFGGAGFVPDIASLQAWIECAWLAGFDAQGAEQLGQEVQGGKKWIGTCETAVVFRYFGIDARIIDFGVVGLQQNGSIVVGDAVQASTIHPDVACDACGASPISGIRYKSEALPNFDLCDQCHARPDAAAAGPFQSISPPAAVEAPQPLSEGCSRAGKQMLDWIWTYFSVGMGAGNNCPVQRSKHQNSDLTLTGLPPLYLQHEGHSRTVVGIERREYTDGKPSEHSLLLLDPGVPPRDLQAALHAGRGWQKWIKRGAHTLRQTQFQVMYPVLRSEAMKTPGTEEYEALKLIAAAQRF